MIKRLSVLASSLLLAAAANAGVISTAVTFVDPAELTDFTRTVQVGKFDSSLGVLTKVSLTLDSAMASILKFAFTGAGSGTADFGTNVTLSMTSSAFGTNVATDLSLEALILAASFSENDRVIEGSVSDVNFVDFDFDTDLSGFVGAAGTTFGLTCSSKTTYLVANIDPLTGTPTSGQFSSADNSTTADCLGGNITYTFDARQPPNGVPEPGTLALIGLALAGMGFTARRRGAK